MSETYQIRLEAPNLLHVVVQGALSDAASQQLAQDAILAAQDLQAPVCVLADLSQMKPLSPTARLEVLRMLRYEGFAFRAYFGASKVVGVLASVLVKAAMSSDWTRACTSEAEARAWLQEQVEYAAGEDPRFQ
ncbi:MAG: STAS/SEC14 domain-containing protein [Chloroflexi bacterium]|nr:STAS/SEC14 domain-containing protein [Chloroflexota bacterium]